MADINIYGKLVNATPEGVLADSEQIKDTVQNKKQSVINSEVKAKLEELESRPEGVSEYSELTEKPQIGGVELVGNLSFEDLGLDIYQTIDDDSLTTSAKTIPAAINEIKESVDSVSDPYEINLTNLLSAEDSESISTAIGGIDNLNATVQDNRIIVGTISNGNVSVSIRILGNVTTLYYLLDSVVGLTLNEIAITNTSGTLSKSVTTHSVLTENMVINSLTSDETTLPLSAAQGKALDNKINVGLSSKQDTLTAGTGIEITPENQINVTLDTNVFFVAESVPASPTDEQKKKICLIPADTVEEGNVYTEYVWVVDDGHPDGYWKEFGTYKSEVDLTPYLKKTEAESTYQKITDNTLATIDKTVTGAINEVLQAIVNGLSEGALFAGIATTTTNPPAYDGNVFYVAIEPGTYSNFGGLEVGASGISILYNSEGSWRKTETFIRNTYNLNDLAPGNYTLETAVAKLLELVISQSQISAGSKLIFTDNDGRIREFIFTYTGSGGRSNLTRWVEDIDNVYFEWHEAILGTAYDIAGLVNSVVVEATGEIDAYAKYSIGQFGYSPLNGCNIIEIYKDNSVIGTLKYEGGTLSAEDTFSNIKISITVSSFDFRPDGGSIANFNAYNRLNRQLFIDAYENYLINNATEKVNHTVGTLININQRFGNPYTQYTLEDAIALIPTTERGACQGLIYLNTVNRPILAIYYATNKDLFANTDLWIEIDCNDITAVTNFSKFQGISAGIQDTYTLDEVIAAIPIGQRMPGKIVIFKNAEDSRYNLAIFNADAVNSGWTNKSNWILVSFENLKQLSTLSTILNGINTELTKKVDKVDGKGLSTNDFTNEDKNKLDSLTPSPDIPEEVIKEAVDAYIEENDAGLVLKDNTLNFIGLHTYKLGENILAIPTVVGTGWSGDMESGFTHATGNEEALEFDISSVPLNSKILIRFNASGLTTESKEVYVSVGDSPKIKSYNGKTEFAAGVIYAGGTLKFTPESLFAGTISDIKCCIISDEGTENFDTTIDSVANKANNFVYGFWNVIIGNAAAAKAQDITRSIAIGYNAMQDMVVGNRNIAIGTFTMPFLTTGENNVAIGADTIYPLKGANNCVGIGKATLGGSQNAEDCVAIGHNAMGIFTLNADRFKCVCIGINAGYSVTENCTHVGHRAGANVIGKNNTSIGYNAMAVGERLSADITGEELTCVGYKAEIDNTLEAKSAVNSTAIGANTKITKSNQLVLGNAAVEEVIIAGKKVIFYEDGTVRWEAVSWNKLI